MKTLLLTVIALLTCLPLQAEIYKYVDENGNVVFSDKRNPAGQDEVVDILPTNTIPSSPQSSQSQLQNRKKPNPNLQKDLYSELRITAPQPEEAIRANAGAITIKIHSAPPLDAAAGDLIKVFIDGQAAAQGISMNVELDSVDRGEHTVQAQIIDTDGQVLKSSDSVKFHVLKHSILFKK